MSKFPPFYPALSKSVSNVPLAIEVIQIEINSDMSEKDDSREYHVRFNPEIANMQSAIDSIDNELAKNKDGKGGEGSPDQLVVFRNSLVDAIKRLENDLLPPKSSRHFGIGRVIADSWPLTSKLGGLLIEAEAAYKSA